MQIRLPFAAILTAGLLFIAAPTTSYAWQYCIQFPADVHPADAVKSPPIRWRVSLLSTDQNPQSTWAAMNPPVLGDDAPFRRYRLNSARKVCMDMAQFNIDTTLGDSHFTRRVRAANARIGGGKSASCPSRTGTATVKLQKEVITIDVDIPGYDSVTVYYYCR